MYSTDLAKLDKLIKNANKWKGESTDMTIQRIVVQFGDDIMNVLFLDWDNVKNDWRVATVQPTPAPVPAPFPEGG